MGRDMCFFRILLWQSGDRQEEFLARDTRYSYHFGFAYGGRVPSATGCREERSYRKGEITNKSS
jgi:hypothetical protein